MPDGTFANRYIGRADDGATITEPVELTSGDTIAEDSESSLGAGPVEHLGFFVDTVEPTCPHPMAERYCPSCGARVDRPE